MRLKGEYPEGFKESLCKGDLLLETWECSQPEDGVYRYITRVEDPSVALARTLCTIRPDGGVEVRTKDALEDTDGLEEILGNMEGTHARRLTPEEVCVWKLTGVIPKS